MQENVGSVDGIIRLVFGLTIISLGIYYQSWLGLIGVIPVGTALVHKCPFYLPFKISTVRKTKE